MHARLAAMMLASDKYFLKCDTCDFLNSSSVICTPKCSQSFAKHPSNVIPEKRRLLSPCCHPFICACPNAFIASSQYFSLSTMTPSKSKITAFIEMNHTLFSVSTLLRFFCGFKVHAILLFYFLSLCGIYYVILLPRFRRHKFRLFQSKSLLNDWYFFFCFLFVVRSFREGGRIFQVFRIRCCHFL